MEESSSKEMYEDIHSLIKEISRESSTSYEVGLNFKFTPTEPSSSGSGEAGSAGGGGEVAGSSDGGEAASPDEGGAPEGPGEGGAPEGPGQDGEPQGPGEGGDTEVSGASQNNSPGLGFSASGGFDTKQSTTNIIKQLSEITVTKVRFRFIACSLLKSYLHFVHYNSHIRLMSHHVHRTGWNSKL